MSTASGDGVPGSPRDGFAIPSPLPLRRNRTYSMYVLTVIKGAYCLHMGGILAEGSAVSAGSASLPTYSVFTSGWNFFKLGTYI